MLVLGGGAATMARMVARTGTGAQVECGCPIYLLLFNALVCSDFGFTAQEAAARVGTKSDFDQTEFDAAIDCALRAALVLVRIGRAQPADGPMAGVPLAPTLSQANAWKQELVAKKDYVL